MDNTKLIYWKLSIVFVLLILITIVIVAISNVQNIANIKPRVEFAGIEQDFVKRDCNTETIYSVNDEQCNTICQSTDTYVSNNGICVNILTFNQSSLENKCSPKHGVVAYLLGDPQFGTTDLRCISIDIGVQPDDITKPNTICTGGTIDINYIESFPQLEQCTCPKGQILTILMNTSTIRSRGICIPIKAKPLYELNNLIY